MLNKIRKDELKRVNEKYAGSKPNETPSPTPKKTTGDETMLQKTTNLLDEAERALVDSPGNADESNLLNSIAPLDQ